MVGCTGRGVFGVLSDGTPAEIDPAASVGGVSLLLGRLPGVEAHTFATNRPTSGFQGEGGATKRTDGGNWPAVHHEPAARGCVAWVTLLAAMCAVHAAPAAGGWGSEAACRAWLGLPAELEPLSLSLFTLNTCTHLLDQCLEGLGGAFPQMVITGE